MPHQPPHTLNEGIVTRVAGIQERLARLALNSSQNGGQ